MSGGRPPAEIQRDIDRTRADLMLTLDALERKLRARHLVEKGFDMFNDTLANNDAVNRGIELIRANPVPAALIGIGAAWMIVNSTSVVDRLAQDDRVVAARQRIADAANDIGNRAGELASDVAARAGIGSGERPLGRTGNPLVDGGERANSDGWVHQVAEMAQGALRSARDSGEAMLTRAGISGDGATRVADQVGEAFRRNPLLIGAVGVMAGALIATLLPRTRVENDWFGDTRDTLWQQARGAGERALSQAREAARRAADAADDAAAESLRRGVDTPSQL